MSPQLPRVAAGQIIRILEHGEFCLSRQSGSHKIYKNVLGKRVTVPFHAAKILHPKVIRNILGDAGTTNGNLTTGFFGLLLVPHTHHRCEILRIGGSAGPLDNCLYIVYTCGQNPAEMRRCM